MIFQLFRRSGLVLGPTWLLIQWVPADLLPGKAVGVWILTLACGATHPLLHTPSWPTSMYMYTWTTNTEAHSLHDSGLTLSLLMSYIYGAPCRTRNFNVVYIWTYVWQRWKPSLSICCTMFQHWINAESYPVSQLYVNTLPATKITLITDGI
jgi:hypothetical protein